MSSSSYAKQVIFQILKVRNVICLYLSLPKPRFGISCLLVQAIRSIYFFLTNFRRYFAFVTIDTRIDTHPSAQSQRWFGFSIELKLINNENNLVVSTVRNWKHQKTCPKMETAYATLRCTDTFNTIIRRRESVLVHQYSVNRRRFVHFGPKFLREQIIVKKLQLTRTRQKRQTSYNYDHY